MSLTDDELVVACNNIGYDLTCGACAELFYTSVRLHPHDEGCKTIGANNSNAVVVFEEGDKKNWFTKQPWADQFAYWWSFVSLHLHQTYHESCKLSFVEHKDEQGKVLRREVVSTCVPHQFH